MQTSKKNTSGQATPPPTDIDLTASGFKTKGRQNVNLSWTPSGNTAQVTVDRTKISGKGTSTSYPTPNDGDHTEATGAKGGSVYDYQVCEVDDVDSSNCSDIERVVF